MPRIARIVVPQYPHHITQRGTNRAEIFIDSEDYLYFLRLLDQWTKKTQSGIWAYCLMNNHFHLLITPVSAEGLGKCLHGITFLYAQHFNAKYNRSGRLWQNRYFSCPVDKEEYLWAVVKYIEMNPVRAQIVKHPEEWRWSSAQEHISGRTDNTLALHKWLRDEEQNEYARMILEETFQEKIRKATSSGRPFGGTKFVDMLEEILHRKLKPKQRGRPRKK